MGFQDCPHADDLSDCTCICPFDPSHLGKDCTCAFIVTPKGAEHRARLAGRARPPRPKVLA